MAQNVAQYTREELIQRGWSTEQINESMRHYPRPSSTPPVLSVTSGGYRSYGTSMQSQSAGSQSNHPSVINTEGPGEYTSYSANIVHSQPVYAARNTKFPDYSSSVHTVHSSDLRAASVVDPREVQAHGYGAPAMNYAAAQSAAQSAARSFANDQAHGQHEGYFALDRQGSIRPETAGTPVGMEQLQTAIPGAKAIPYRNDLGEGPYGIWPDSPWDKGYFPTFTAYITTVHRGTVERPGFWEFSEETQSYETVNSLEDIVKILNAAGRPPGFERISQRRPGNGFTCQQVADLLSILADKGNPNRGNAFGQVLNWANSGDLSPKRVLRNVPETIVTHYRLQDHEALADKLLRWEWHIKSFLYKEDPNPNHPHWYVEGPSKDKRVRKPSESESGTKRSAPSSTVPSDHSHRPIASSSHHSHRPVASSSHHSHKPRHKKRQVEEHES